MVVCPYFSFQFSDFCGKLFVPEGGLAQLDEGANNKDIHPHCRFAVEHAGCHDRAVLSRTHLTTTETATPTCRGTNLMLRPLSPAPLPTGEGGNKSTPSLTVGLVPGRNASRVSRPQSFTATVKNGASTSRRTPKPTFNVRLTVGTFFLIGASAESGPGSL